MRTTEVIARTYARRNGQTCLELVSIGQGRYIIAVDGRINDARHKITTSEAREWYDDAPYKVGPRPQAR